MKGFRFIFSPELCPFAVCFSCRGLMYATQRWSWREIEREERKRSKQQHVKNVPTLDPSVTAVGRGGLSELTA
jgi:hypothetical protein